MTKTLDAFSLAGKHVVIVGASSGIGRSIATHCAEAGAKMSLGARRVDRLQQVTTELPGTGHGCCVLDVTQEDGIVSALDGFVRDRGPIEGFVYAAGIMTLRPLNVLPLAMLQETLTVNLQGAVRCCQAAIANTRASAEGMSIVLISSIAADLPRGSGLTAYAASKAGMAGAVRAMAVESARRRIRVNLVSPAIVRTEMWEQSPMTDPQRHAIEKRHLLGLGDPADVAHACVYLLSPAARWVTGTTLVLDGGYTLS